ncbi:MAG TPA: hypothetical protein VFD58_28235 [Blastocatellia bacterium]|nr:hypothetical protein [Blastocatellia bacterium]
MNQIITFGRSRQAWHKGYLDNENLNRVWPVLGGVGLGAALMYVLDPDRGSARRAYARDKFTSAVNKTGTAISSKSRDLSNRARGVMAEAGSLFRSEQAGEGSELRH